MKTPFFLKILATAGTLILAVAGTAIAAENWQDVPAEVSVPAAGEYVVLADESWLADAKAKAEITKFAKRHGNAKIVPLNFGDSAGTQKAATGDRRQETKSSGTEKSKSAAKQKAQKNPPKKKPVKSNKKDKKSDKNSAKNAEKNDDFKPETQNLDDDGKPWNLEPDANGAGTGSADFTEISEPFAGTLKTLKQLRPRYIAAILKPEKINRKTVGDLLRISRKIDAKEDFHVDAIVGILTADSAETLAKVLAPTPTGTLELKRAAGTTNFDIGRFERGFVVLDWGGDQQYYLRENGETNLKKLDVPAKSIELFGEQFDATNPQYFISASHATEFNLEMPFSRGMIVPAKGKFWLLKADEMWKFGQVTNGNFSPNGLKSLAQNDEPKIWIAAGNCLIGDALGNAESMVVTAISRYGFRQFVGYTVPSWFGRGWEIHGNFFNGSNAMQVGQAWLFCMEKTLLNLPEAARDLPVNLPPLDMEMLNVKALQQALRERGLPSGKNMVGNLHDRDTIAFYGDPIFPVKFAGGKPLAVKLKRLAGTQKCRLMFRGNAKAPVCFWFPQRANVRVKPILRERDKDGGVRKLERDFVFTENFIMLGGDGAYDFSAGGRLEIDFELAGTAKE